MVSRVKDINGVDGIILRNESQEFALATGEIGIRALVEGEDSGLFILKRRKFLKALAKTFDLYIEDVDGSAYSATETWRGR